MAKNETAKLFRNGSSQAVRLPRKFRFEGDCVRVRQVANGVLLQPLIADPKEWFKKLDEIEVEPLLPARRQPATPKRAVFDKE